MSIPMESAEKMKLRILTFSRILNVAKASEESDSKPQEFNWIALGHFDYMRTESIDLSNNNLFDEIHKKENALKNEALNTSTYLHSLYLLTTTDDKEKWKTDKPFIAVSRIHFKDNVHTNKPREEFLKANAGKISEEISWHEYKTSEISDLIVVCWSSNLKLLVEWVMNIREHDTVGKVYSYFCFQRQYLYQNLPSRDSYTIPVVEIRMSVGAANEGLTDRIEEIKRNLKVEDLYTLSGYDDLVLFGKDIYPQSLIDLYKEWINNVEYKDKWPFLDVTTSIGADYSGWNSSSTTSPLRQYCDSLISYNNRVSIDHGDFVQSNDTWRRHVDDLLKALLSMSSSVTTDELVYLFYPSVKTFIQHEGTYSEEKYLQLFIDKWSEAIELVIRNEGQFSLYPEIHPRLFSFSFFLMEFIMSFLYKCEIILKDRNQDGHEVLLIPVREKRISTREIFRQTDNNHGLVIMNIPIPKLTDTRIALSSLCHEISHFVGEEARCREERISGYARAISAEAAYALFGNCNKELVNIICNGYDVYPGLMDYIERRSHYPHQEENHMICIQEMKKYASSWFEFVLSNEDKYYSLWRCAIEKMAQGYSDIISIKTFKAAKDLKNSIDDKIHNISELFREVYADICMILILNLDAMTYIQLLEDDVVSGNIQMESSDTDPLQKQKETAIYYSAIRAFICMRSTRISIPHMSDSSVFTNTLRGIHALYDFLWTEGDLNKQTKAQAVKIHETINPVLDYANQCRDKIEQKLIIHKDQLLALQEAFENVTGKNTIDITKAEELIDEFRNSVCNDDFYKPVS